MNIYKRHRFPSDIISYAVWLYYRFNLSHRDIEDLLAERGIIVIGRHLVSANHYRNLRVGAFSEWNRAVA